jgi:hypothetical protein
MVSARKPFASFAVGGEPISAKERARVRRQKVRRIQRALEVIDRAIVNRAACGDDDYVRTLRAASARLQSLGERRNARKVLVIRPLPLDVRRVLDLVGFAQLRCSCH